MFVVEQLFNWFEIILDFGSFDRWIIYKSAKYIWSTGRWLHCILWDEGTMDSIIMQVVDSTPFINTAACKLHRRAQSDRYYQFNGEKSSEMNTCLSDVSEVTRWTQHAYKCWFYSTNNSQKDEKSWCHSRWWYRTVHCSVPRLLTNRASAGSKSLKSTNYASRNSHLLNITEFWRLLQYSAIIGDYFTISHILAECLNQSLAVITLAKDGCLVA